VFCRYEVAFNQLNVAEVNQVVWWIFRSFSKQKICAWSVLETFVFNSYWNNEQAKSVLVG